MILLISVSHPAPPPPPHQQQHPLLAALLLFLIGETFKVAENAEERGINWLTSKLRKIETNNYNINYSSTVT